MGYPVDAKIIAAAVTAVILLPTTFFALSKTGSLPGQGKTCTSATCKAAAKRMLFSMNSEVKPCDNFYQFACGNYVKKNEFNTYSAYLGNKVREQIRDILTENKKNDPQIFKTVKKLFQLCMDEKGIEERKATPGVEFLNKAGGWPVLNNWNSNNWSYIKTRKRLLEMGFEDDSLISTYIALDPTDTTKRIVQVGASQLLIPKDILLQGDKAQKVKAYFDFMVDLAVYYGADSEQAKKHMTEVLKFQIDFAKILEPLFRSIGSGDPSIQVFTIEELQKLPGTWFDWEELVGDFTATKPSKDQKIAVQGLNVIQKIGKLYQKYPPQVIADHVMWKAAADISYLLSSSIRGKVRKFFGNELQGRWEECFLEIQVYGLALSSMYVRKHFDETVRKKATEISNGIQKEMEKELTEVEWMDKETRKKAQQKAAKLVHVVGYPKEIFDTTKIEELYTGLRITDESHFEATFETAKMLRALNQKQLTLPFVRKHWTSFGGSAIATNVYYFPRNNAIDVPASLLQEPFFSTSFPNYLNYANIGFSIGHEITRAFDAAEGRNFDDEGNIQDWWNKDSSKNYKEKRQCMVDQYSKFVESQTKVNVNGATTEAANVADNGGWKLAYRAYHQLKKPDPALPGLEKYSNDQMFLLSFANMWCTRDTKEIAEYKMYTSEHSPAEWRVNGVLMNMPHFGKIFGCAKGTPMNPEQKCNVW